MMVHHAMPSASIRMSGKNKLSQFAFPPLSPVSVLRTASLGICSDSRPRPGDPIMVLLLPQSTRHDA